MAVIDELTASILWTRTMQNTSTLTSLLARNWKWLLWRGIAGILFGMAALCWPGMTLLALVLIYGAYALVDGVFALGAACTGGSAMPRWYCGVCLSRGQCAGADFVYRRLDAGARDL